MVPPGTGARLDRGEDIEVLPRRLEMSVGQRLVMTNFDHRTHLVGPFSVRAGEELSHLFPTPGVFSDQCTLHPDGAITISVR